MQSEDFDNKIKEAADHHHPAYDEKAWGKMEKLLDKHLPVEKDNRRRFIFFVLFALLLGSGALIVANRTQNNIKAIAVIKNDSQESNIAEPAKNNSSEKTEMAVGVPGKSGKETIAKTKSKADVDNNTKIPAQPFAKKYKKRPTVRPGEEEEVAGILITPHINNRRNNEKYITVPTMMDNNLLPGNIEIDRDKQKKITHDDKKIITDSPVTAISSDNNLTGPVTGKNAGTIDSVKMDSKEPISSEMANKKNEPVAQKQKAKNKKGSSFFFTVSAGPDISFTGSDKPGKMKLLGGAGAGYTFKDRFTVRTGFYSGRKIYTASPDQYHPPAEFWTYYPYLEKIDADCKVYEIPLSFSYNFSSSIKQKWFASAGLSSYIMKKEEYNFYYKQTPAGPTLNRSRTIENANKHYFSVVTLSGGYQRSISKNISLIVEPYLKLPLSGVGYGKVKLNSGGILFSIGIKPFTGAKKQQQ